jgi:hypothetical protein
MFRNLIGQSAARERISGTLLASLQPGLALAALACGWMAIRQGLIMSASASSLCLGAAKYSGLGFIGHCAWCYSALALMALAAWPVGAKGPIRAHSARSRQG